MVAPTPPPHDNRRAPDAVRRNRLWIIAALAVVLVLVVAGGFLAAPYFTVSDPTNSGTPPATASASAPAKRPPARPGDCRDFTKEVTIEGETRTVSGRACMQQDGSWQIVD